MDCSSFDIDLHWRQKTTEKPLDEPISVMGSSRVKKSLTIVARCEFTVLLPLRQSSFEMFGLCSVMNSMKAFGGFLI